MKQLLLAILVFCSIGGYTQTQDSANRNIMVGIRIQGGLGYRDLSSVSSDPAVISMMNFRDKNENPIMVFGFGLEFMRPVGNRILGSVGVNYSILGFGSSQKLNPPVNDIVRVKTYDQFHYIEIPIKSTFIISKRLSDLNVSTGISPAALLKSNFTATKFYVDDDQKSSKFDLTNDYQKFNFFVSISAGFGRKIGSRCYFRGDLEYKHGILKIIDSPITAALFGLGANLGFYYSL